MKFNKLKRKSNNEEIDHLKLQDHINLDRETQRLKWRIYKRKYRQKMRKSGTAMKRKVRKKEKKITANERISINELKTNDNTRIEIHSIDSKFKAVHSAKKLNIDRGMKSIKTKNIDFESSRICRNENTDRETMREKWRRYKKRYREKKRYNKILTRMDSQSSPKIVEEDTAIYFVEDDFSTNEFMYENDDNEDHKYECNIDESPRSFEIHESKIETITVKCEPSTCFFT